MSDFLFWVGIDWGNDSHQVCVLDQKRQLVFERSVKHDGKAIGRLASELIARANGDAPRIAVGIETTRGAIIETLIERGMAAFSINPMQLDRFRDRHTIAGAKDDRRDAFVLADSLWTDTRLFRPITPRPAELVELRELVRVYEDLKDLINIQGNRLNQQLHRYYPQLLNLGSVYKDIWLWDVFELAPTPDKTKQLLRHEVKEILKKHRVRRMKAEQVIETLCSHPLQVAPGVVNACEQHISMLLPLLRMAIRKRLECVKKLQKKLCQMVEQRGEDSQFSDAAILMSFPGVGTIVGATILAEVSHLLAARDLARLRANCGVAPVTRRSGRSQLVVRRLARNKQLAEAVHYWSSANIKIDPKSKSHYNKLRTAGHRHARALRGVGDRLLSTLITLLRRGELYDPSYRESLNPNDFVKGQVATEMSQ